jgi:hypothetical protein
MELLPFNDWYNIFLFHLFMPCLATFWQAVNTCKWHEFRPVHDDGYKT